MIEREPAVNDRSVSGLGRDGRTWTIATKVTHTQVIALVSAL